MNNLPANLNIAGESFKKNLLIIKNIPTEVWDDFKNFIIDNNLTSLLMIALFGIGITYLLNSLKTNIIEYYFNKLFKTSNNNLITFLTSLIQFIIIILILYLIYRIAFRKMIKNKTETLNTDLEWKNSVLKQLTEINSKMK
jgi:large-conductance mechanosensitive channel